VNHLQHIGFLENGDGDSLPFWGSRKSAFTIFKGAKQATKGVFPKSFRPG